MISIFTIYSDLCKLSMPVHWRIYRLKDIITSSRSGIWGDEEKRDSNDVVCYRVADFDYFNLCLKFNDITYRNILPEQVNEKLLSEGDLLLEKSGGGEKTPVGRVVFVNSSQKAVCSNFIQALSVNQEQSARFVLYLFHSIYSNRINTLFFNQTTGIQNLKVSHYLAQEILLPPYSEQEAIVVYLDKECGKIGKEIGLLERKVDCYRRLKHSLINQTVIRGINPNVTRKPSGNSWIADIPMHWNVRPIRSFITLITPEKRGETEYQLLSVTRDKGIIIRGERGEDGNNNRIPDDLSNYKVVKWNQFVVNKMKAWMGAYGISKYQGIVSPAYYICDVHDIYEPFFSIAIRCRQYINFFWKYSKGIRVDQWDMSPLALKEIPFVTPPIEEQHEIVAYLDDKCNKIDAIIKMIESKIELLKELKRSLINEVVTGQRAINISKS